MQTTTDDEIIEGTIHTLAFGGNGILRHQGFVIFVPFTAPGDLVRVRITKRKKRYAEGELVELMQPGPDRAAPACPSFGICGGCQLQHISAKAQNHYKSASIQDALNRIGHLPVKECLVKEAKEPWAYRRSIRLGLRPVDLPKQGYAMGYIAADHHTFHPITVCPIFTSKEDLVLIQLQECLSAMHASPLNNGHVVIMKHPDAGYLFDFHFTEQLPLKAAQLLQEALKKWPLWRGIILNSPGETMTWGESAFSFIVEDLSFHASPSVFLQNHTDQSLLLYREIVDQAMQAGASSVLDLYCGIGITSLLLAKRGLSVTSVELNAKAIEFAKESAQINHLNKVDFLTEPTETALPRLKHKHFDLVLLNPPRSGLSPVVKKHLLEIRPKTLIYISCMPSTLARDLDPFHQKGYQLHALQGWDMFPQTAHVETMAALKLAYE